jgi:hypothetical protein
VTDRHTDDRARAARRRRLAEVFGDADLPEQTRDDAEDPGDPAERRTDTDEWLRNQVPPHHGS